MNKTMGSFEWTLLIILSILWGGSFFFSKVALNELPPFTVVFARVFLAAMAMNIVLLAKGQRLPGSIKLWGTFLIMGLLNNLIPFSLIFWAQTEITSSLASILNGTTPIWTVLLAHFLTKDEKLSINKFTGIIIGFTGVIVMIGVEVLSGIGLNVLAQLAVVMATLSYAFAGIFGKRFGNIPPMIIATGQITSTTIIMLPVVLWFDKPWLLSTPSINTIGALLGLSFLSTSVAYVIYFKLLFRAGATNLLLVTFLIPVSASILGITILDEVLKLQHYIGMILIGLGLVAIDGRLLKISINKAKGIYN